MSSSSETMNKLNRITGGSLTLGKALNAIRLCDYVGELDG
jgi:hypothetical protein